MMVFKFVVFNGTIGGHANLFPHEGPAVAAQYEIETVLPRAAEHLRVLDEGNDDSMKALEKPLPVKH